MGFSEHWAKANEPANEFEPADGLHEVKITDGGAFTGNDGREWCKVELEITEGDDAGQRFDDFRGLNSETATRIAKDNLVMYGVRWEDVKDLEDLDSALVELTGTQATVKVSHSESGGRVYRNVKVISSRTGASDIPEDKAFPPALKNGERRFEDDVPAKAPATADDDSLPY